MTDDPPLDELLIDACLYSGLVHGQGSARPLGLLSDASQIDNSSARAIPGHPSLIGKGGGGRKFRGQWAPDRCVVKFLRGQIEISENFE